MKQFEFGPEVALAIAFLIGYSGIRLLPKLEQQLFKRINKIGGEEPK